MPGPATSPNRVAIAGAWRRLNQALLPDYNRKATVYWWTIVSSPVRVKRSVR